MEQFVFTDIFDTKGIEYIVVIFFFLLLIPFWYLLNRPLKVKQAAGEAIQALNLKTLRIPQGLFFNRNHTWTHMEKSGLASVGMDDLLLHLTGGVQVAYLKEQQEKVKRGEPIARIIRDGKELVIHSPISGQIDRVHSSLETHPESISKDPYEAWIYRIKPDKWQEETAGAMLASEAMEWTGKELERFRDYLAETLNEEGVVLQEGGELMGHPLEELDQEAWSVFEKKFLHL